jgi:hypothetical protein
VKPSPEQARVLGLMAAGWTLKAHRYLDGRKIYQLHALDGATQPVRAATVEALVAGGWLDSNKKFPAATFWLTPIARQLLLHNEE